MFMLMFLFCSRFFAWLIGLGSCVFCSFLFCFWCSFCLVLSCLFLSPDGWCSWGWHWTLDPPASTFWVLGSQVFSTLPNFMQLWGPSPRLLAHTSWALYQWRYIAGSLRLPPSLPLSLHVFLLPFLPFFLNPTPPWLCYRRCLLAHHPLKSPNEGFWS